MSKYSPGPTPVRGVYGFVLFFCSWLFFVAYLIWAFLPTLWLNYIGITYFPDKHWAITAPFSIAFFFISIPFIYSLINMHMVRPVESIYTFKDKYACEPVPYHKLPLNCIPPISDICLSEVCRALYLRDVSNGDEDN